MKTPLPGLLILLLSAAPLITQAQSGSGDNFDYTINPGDTNTITISSYAGTDTFVTIPAYINNLLVTSIQNSNVNTSAFPGVTTGVTIPDCLTSIGDNAFFLCSLTNITIPASVTNIGVGAFLDCYFLTAINVDSQNAFYSSANGVWFDKGQTLLIQFPEGLGGSYSIPGTVTSIGLGAFYFSLNLTGVTIPNGVTNIDPVAFASCFKLTCITIPSTVASIGANAFFGCPILTNAYFTGNAPDADTTVFAADNDALTTYYLPGTTGWSLGFWGYPTSGPPALLWNPQIQTNGPNFGVRNNQFGFNIIGTNNFTVTVEACTNLANPAWTPLQTVTLTNGSCYFTDPGWTNYPTRYYGLGFP